MSPIPKGSEHSDRVVPPAAPETSSLPQNSLLNPPGTLAVQPRAEHLLLCLPVLYFTTEIGLCSPK